MLYRDFVGDKPNPTKTTMAELDEKRKLIQKAIVEKLSLREYDRLRELIPPNLYLDSYVNNVMAADIRESLKDGE